MRVKLVCKKALSRASEIRTNELASGEDALEDDDQGSFEKLVKQTENLVKLCMQKLVTSFKALQDDDDLPIQSKLSNTADNSVGNIEGGAATTSINDE